MIRAHQLDLWPDDMALNRIVWSVSRDRLFHTCLRKYYYYHYGSRGGFRADAPASTKEIYVLKHLKNRYMWVGEIVHELVEMILSAWRRGEHVPLEGIIERGVRKMRAQYAESIQGMYRERPRAFCGLIEHEYQEDITREEWRAIRDRMENCIRNFYNFDLIAEIQQTPPWQWLAIENMASIDFEGDKVIVKPDFTWQDENQCLRIVDWKTGQLRLAEEWSQISIYALHAKRAWGNDHKAIKGELVYLEENKLASETIQTEDLERAQNMIRNSLKHMREYPHGQQAPDMEKSRFPKIEEQSTCQYCNFRRLCKRD